MEICLEGEEWMARRGARASRRRPTAPQSHRQAGVCRGAQRHECGGGRRAGSFSLLHIRRNLSWSFSARPYRPSIASRGGGGRNHDSRRLLQRLARVDGGRARDARRAHGTWIQAERSRSSATCWSSAKLEEEAHRTLGRSARNRVDARRLLRPPVSSLIRRILFFSFSAPLPLPRPTSPRSIRSSPGFARASSRATPSS